MSMYKPLLATACAALMLAACGDRTQAVVAASSPDTRQPARNFMLFFGNDHANVTPESEGVIQEAARAARANPDARITVFGNADTFGDSAYNLGLSQRRAEAVRDALVADGINPATISVAGHGEDALLVSTRDGVREPKNRRVEIVVQ
ncbi:MAG TPA: OmpA family protein [Reyranella sp.]|jgi:outer membrane protein OmpA-like peptidoglycan-associated protein